MLASAALALLVVAPASASHLRAPAAARARTCASAGMATFLRRQLQKLGRKDETPTTLTINRPEGGNVTLAKIELQRYSMLHAVLDSDMDGEVGGMQIFQGAVRLGDDDIHLELGGGQ